MAVIAIKHIALCWSCVEQKHGGYVTKQYIYCPEQHPYQNISKNSNLEILQTTPKNIQKPAKRKEAQKNSEIFWK